MEYEELFVKSPEIVLNKKVNIFSVSTKINTERCFFFFALVVVAVVHLHYGYLLTWDTVFTKPEVLQRGSYKD